MHDVVLYVVWLGGEERPSVAYMPSVEEGIVPVDPDTYDSLAQQVYITN